MSRREPMSPEDADMMYQQEQYEKRGNRPPSFPVIVVHLDDGTGHTVCNGDDMPLATTPRYQHTPRYFCVACQRFGVTGDADA